jgi:hypothetical protein
MHHRLNMGYTIKAQVLGYIFILNLFYLFSYLFLCVLVPLSQALKGPKHEIFGSRVFTQIRPQRAGDLGIGPKNSKFG